MPKIKVVPWNRNQTLPVPQNSEVRSAGKEIEMMERRKRRCSDRASHMPHLFWGLFCVLIVRLYLRLDFQIYDFPDRAISSSGIQAKSGQAARATSDDVAATRRQGFGKLSVGMCAVGFSNAGKCIASGDTGDIWLPVKFSLNGEDMRSACAPNGSVQSTCCSLDHAKFENHG